MLTTTGKQEEAGFGLQYFGARWYSPEFGVFISRDPVGFLPWNLAEKLTD